MTLPSRFGGSYTGTTSPYASSPRPLKRQGVAPTTAPANFNRGIPERIPGDGREGWLLDAAKFSTQAVPSTYERPLALVGAAADVALGRQPNKPSLIDNILGGIGSIGRGSPLSIEGILHVADETLQREGSIYSAISNKDEAERIRSIVENHMGMNDQIKVNLTSAAEGVAAGNFQKTVTVSDYLQELQDRGFFNSVDENGNPVQLTPQDLVDRMNASGPLGDFQFGDKQTSPSSTNDLVERMIADPLNIAFGLGAFTKVAKAAGFAGKFLPEMAKIGPWAAAPSVIGKVPEGIRGVNYLEDVARMGVRTTDIASHATAAQAIMAGNGGGGTLKGLGLVLQSLAKNSVGMGAGSIPLRYAKASLIQQSALLATEQASGFASQVFGETDTEGNAIHSGFFSSVHDASQSILDDHPLSGNQLFVVATMFGTPFHEGGAAALKATKLKIKEMTGSGYTARMGRAYGGEKGIAAENALLSKLGSAPGAFDEATGRFNTKGADLAEGRRQLAIINDYTSLQIAFDRASQDPSFVAHYKSLDNLILSGEPMVDTIRGYRDHLVDTGIINDKMLVDRFQQWAQDHVTSYLDEQGVPQSVVSPGGWDLPPDAILAQWLDWSRGNESLVNSFGSMRHAVLGRAQTMTKEGMDQLITVVEQATTEGRVSSAVVRGSLLKRPAMFVDLRIPLNTREYFAQLMNRGVASGTGVHGAGQGMYDANELLDQLRAVRDKIPEGGEFTHEATQMEAGVLDDTQMAGSGGPVGPQGVNKLWTQAEVQAHQVRSTTEGRNIAKDIKDSEAVYNSRWSRRGKYKGDERDINVEAAGYHRAGAAEFDAALKQNVRPEFMTPLGPKEAQKSRIFLSRDGNSGFAINADGELRNLFNNVPGTGAGERAIDIAIEAGATKLDAFDGFLTKLYAKHGFVETSRVKFDPQYAPEGWDYAKYGRPDVVYMAIPGEGVLDAQDVNALEGYLLHSAPNAPSPKLDRAFEHTPATTEPLTAFRNVDAKELAILESHIGSEYVAPKYTSIATEGSPYLANPYKGGSVVRVEVPAGAKAIDMDAVRQHPEAMPISGEAPSHGEHLLPYGSKFDVAQEGGQIVLTLKPAEAPLKLSKNGPWATDAVMLDESAGPTNQRIANLPPGDPNTITFDSPTNQATWYGPDGTAHAWAAVTTKSDGTLQSVAVYVDPEFRRQRVASALYDELQAQGYNLAPISGKTTTEMGAGFSSAYWSAKEAPPVVEEVPAPQNSALETMRVNERAAIDAKKAQLLEVKKYLVQLRQRSSEIGAFPLHHTYRTRDGKLSVSGEDLQRIREQSKWVQDNMPDHEIKKPPQLNIPWDAADSVVAALNIQRTNIGRTLFDYGPLAKITQTLDYLMEPVNASRRVRDTHQMLYSQMMRLGATEAQVGMFIRDLARRRQETGTLGPMKIAVARYENSLLTTQIQQAGESVFGNQIIDGVLNIGNQTFMNGLSKEFGGQFYRLLDRSANSLVRRGEQAMMAEGSNLSGNDILAKSFAQGYAAWQHVPVLHGVSRFVDKVGYPFYRFFLSLRWQTMNVLENDLLGIFQDGIKATRFSPLDQGNFQGNAYHLAQARKFGRRVDPRLTGEAPPIMPGIPDELLPETGSFTGRFLEPVARRQFDARARAELSKMLDELPVKSPEARWMIEHFGPTKGTWADEIENMWLRWDHDGVESTLAADTKLVAAQDKWTPEEINQMQPFLLRLGELQAKAYDDVAHIQLGNTDRPRMERALNSYWLFWPLSYQIKTAKWMVDLMTNRLFGQQSNLGGAYLFSRTRDMFLQQYQSNPAFRDQIDNNPTMILMFSMMFPAVPWDQGVSLSRVPRYVGGNILHLWPEYAGLNNPADYAQKSLELGARYDTELLSRFFGEQAAQSDQSTTIQPTRR